LSNIILVEINGIIDNLKNQCERLGLNYKQVSEYNRLHKEIDTKSVVEFYQIKSIFSYKSRRRLYTIWHNMKNRCENPNHNAYKNYGDRGIKICDRWKYFEYFCIDMIYSYQQHVEEYGEKNTTLDRIDYNGNYELSNCKWATIIEQVNNRRNTIRLENGESLSNYCRRNNLRYRTIMSRLLNGWEIDEAINTPIQTKCRHNDRVSPTGETMSQLAKRLGISKRLLDERFRAGWDWDKIINTKVREAIYYLPCNRTLRQHCIINNYDYNLIASYYIKKCNLSPHEALAKYLENKQKKNTP